MATNNITEKICDFCKKCTKSYRDRIGGMPFEGWLELKAFTFLQGTIMDFCSEKCLHDYLTVKNSIEKKYPCPCEEFPLEESKPLELHLTHPLPLQTDGPNSAI